MASALFDRMFLLLPAQATTNYSVRGLLPQLIQDIVMVQAFTEAQKSSLLAAFYPGCGARALHSRAATAMVTWTRALPFAGTSLPCFQLAGQFSGSAPSSYSGSTTTCKARR